MKDSITVYTDGAARGNPGPGGYGVILMSGNIKKELSSKEILMETAVHYLLMI